MLSPKTVANTRAAAVITSADVLMLVAIAKKHHAASKDSAAEAAAHAYVIWRDTLGPGADAMLTQQMITWIDGENEKIADHNKGLAEDTKLKKDEKLKLRQVPITAREGASRFTVIVKYVFGFVRAADASLVARYAKVLEWIDGQFGNVVINSTDEIVSAIKKAGGFEDVLAAARCKVQPASKIDRDRKMEAIRKLAQQAVQGAETKTELNVVLETDEAVVVLLGRYENGTLAVVADRVLDPAEISAWLPEFRDDVRMPVDDRTEFLARLLDMGQLVAEGAVTEYTEHDTVTGSKLREERLVTLRSNDTNEAEFVVSACRTEASIIVKAVAAPKIGIVAPVSPLVIGADIRAALDAWIVDRDERSLVSIKIDGPRNDNDLPIWTAVNEAFGDSDGANVDVDWDALSHRRHMPVDEDGFRASIITNVTRAALKELDREAFADEKKLMNAAQKTDGETKATGKNAAKPKLAKLIFEGAEMRFGV